MSTAGLVFDASNLATSGAPRNVRDPVLLMLELVGEDTGLIPQIIFPEKDDPQMLEQKDRRKRRRLQELLESMDKYTRLYARVALKVSIAEHAADAVIDVIEDKIHAIEDTIREIRSMPAGTKGKKEKQFRKASDPAKDIRQLKEVKAKVETFRDKTLRRHRHTLETEEQPDTRTLETIEQDVDKGVKAIPALKRAYTFAASMAAFASVPVQAAATSYAYLRRKMYYPGGPIPKPVSQEKTRLREALRRSETRPRRTGPPPSPDNGPARTAD